MGNMSNQNRNTLSLDLPSFISSFKALDFSKIIKAHDQLIMCLCAHIAFKGSYECDNLDPDGDLVEAEETVQVYAWNHLKRNTTEEEFLRLTTDVEYREDYFLSLFQKFLDSSGARVEFESGPRHLEENINKLSEEDYAAFRKTLN